MKAVNSYDLSNPRVGDDISFLLSFHGLTGESSVKKTTVGIAIIEQRGV